MLPAYGISTPISLRFLQHQPVHAIPAFDIKLSHFPALSLFTLCGCNFGRCFLAGRPVLQSYNPQQCSWNVRLFFPLILSACPGPYTNDCTGILYGRMTHRPSWRALFLLFHVFTKCFPSLPLHLIPWQKLNFRNGHRFVLCLQIATHWQQVHITRGRPCRTYEQGTSSLNT